MSSAAPVHVIVLLNPAMPPLAKLDPEQLAKLQALEKTFPNFKLTVTASPEQLGHETCCNADGLIAWACARPHMEAFFKVCGSAPRKLRWVHSIFAGIDALLCKELVEDQTITLTLSKGVWATSLAEYVIMGLMYFEKDIPRLQRQMKEKKWDRYMVGELWHKKMCIIGYGDIGRCTAERAKAMGMTVTAVKRQQSTAADQCVDKVVVGKEAMLREMAEADYVVMCTPLTAETKGMMGKAELAVMKKEAIFVNVGRGPCVDEAALIDALQNKRIRAAVVDVTAVEPCPPESPLWDLDNILISPHTADVTPSWPDDTMKLVVDNTTRLIEGKPMLFVADKTAGY